MHNSLMFGQYSLLSYKSALLACLLAKLAAYYGWTLMYHILDLSNSVKTVTFPMKGQYQPMAEAWYYMLVCVRGLCAAPVKARRN